MSTTLPEVRVCTKRHDRANNQPVIIAFRGRTTILLVNSDAEVIAESNIDLGLNVERTFVLNSDCVVLVDFYATIYTFNLSSCTLYSHEKQTTSYNNRLNDNTILLCNEIDTFETYNVHSKQTEMKQQVGKHIEPAVVNDYQFALLHRDCINIWDTQSQTIVRTMNINVPYARYAHNLWLSARYANQHFIHIKDYDFCYSDGHKTHLFNVESGKVVQNTTMTAIEGRSDICRIGNYVVVFERDLPLFGVRDTSATTVKLLDINDQYKVRQISVPLRVEGDYSFDGYIISGMPNHPQILRTSLSSGVTDTLADIVMEVGSKIVALGDKVLILKNRNEAYLIDKNSLTTKVAPLYWRYHVNLKQ
jgi:hypothetical protein